MAKRRRKMTLFDVINTGQPIGLQHRQRVPTYQPTPELPVKKKLAKLFGRKASTIDPDRPLSAAEELDRLRRELLGSTTTTRIQEAPVVDHYADEVPAEEAAPPMSAAERTRLRFQMSESERPIGNERVVDETPRVPRTPITKILGDAARNRWAAAAPKLSAVAEKARAVGADGASFARAQLYTLREVNSRYAVTALAAAAVVVLLGGSFYAGKLLFNRPAVQLASSTGSETLADDTVRPEVLNVPARTNEPFASVANRATEVTVQRNVDAPEKPTAAFGGRRPDWNYIIIQSYATQAEADATIEVLNKYGVKATVETNLPRWAASGKTLYSVVSAAGFAQMKGNPEYADFVKTIEKISDKEAGATLPRRLQPNPYRFQPQQPQ